MGEILLIIGGKLGDGCLEKAPEEETPQQTTS